MNPAFSICVYCGSRSGERPEFAESARAVGHWIGERHGQLVYGGGRTGLMGTVAEATREAGGRVRDPCVPPVVLVVACEADWVACPRERG